MQEQQKREENQRGRRGVTNPQQITSPMRRREERMDEQNRVNEVKYTNTQRQEIEVVKRREQVGEGAIWKVRT